VKEAFTSYVCMYLQVSFTAWKATPS